MKNTLPTSRKLPLLILGITALVFSRTLLFAFNDPEGPNLLVVIVAAVFVYLVSLTAFIFGPSASDSKKIWVAIFIQMILAIVLYILGVMF